MKTEEGERLLQSTSQCHTAIYCPATRKQEIKSQYSPEGEDKVLFEGGIEGKSYFGERWRREAKSILKQGNEMPPKTY